MFRNLLSKHTRKKKKKNKIQLCTVLVFKTRSWCSYKTLYPLYIGKEDIFFDVSYPIKEGIKKGAALFPETAPFKLTSLTIYEPDISKLFMII
jgi:hypothetical protein